MSSRAGTQTTSMGRYHVLRRLAKGGMADVLLARTEGLQGFARHVVIKRIRPDLVEDKRYVTMFLDEARLAAALHHHNIVQVNDIGEHAGAYFFAMEYIHGEDARTLLVNASERGRQIPIEHVLTIISGAAAGLHHAHEQRGLDGKPLNVVHRDVSPANLLVGFDGAVKVADFGIAFASQRSEKTQAGTLKGKVAYMSPEQCNCAPVDRRSDVFSLGICLYELATVHPCFAGENDFLTMSAIAAGRYTPPSHLSADVTPALEAIIAKALAHDPKDRYQSCEEMRQAVDAYATTMRLRTSTTALADYMKEQFGDKALPWQTAPVPDEEEDLELEIISPLAPIASAGAPDIDDRFDDDDDLAIPVAPRDESNVRMIARALAPDEIAPIEPTSPANRAFAAATPTARISLARPRRRTLTWGTALLVLVVIAGSLLGLAASAEEVREEAAVISPPASTDPFERPNAATVHEPAFMTIERESKPVPGKVPARRRRGAPKWDPNALFPK